MIHVLPVGGRPPADVNLSGRATRPALTRPTLTRPTLTRPTLTRPTLTRPTRPALVRSPNGARL
jgi:hypothetical protein